MKESERMADQPQYKLDMDHQGRTRDVKIPRSTAKTTEKDVQAARDAQFRLLVEAVQDYAIFMLDPAGNVKTWNAGARRIKQYIASDIIGKHFSTFYPEEEKRNGKPQWELEVAQKEGRFEDEGWRIRKDGSRFWANVIITALRDKSGRLVGFGKVTRDFTERMEVKEALAKSERSLRELSLHLLSTQDEERKRERKTAALNRTNS